MKNNPGAKVSGSKRAQPTVAGSLSEPAIRRQLLSDAVQHPATLLPLAVSTASAIYLVVLSPVLGRAPWAVWIARAVRPRGSSLVRLALHVPLHRGVRPEGSGAHGAGGRGAGAA